MTLIDPELVQRFTGQREICSEEVAFANLQVATRALNHARASQKFKRNELQRAKAGLSWNLLRLRIARLPSSLKIEGWVIVIACCSLAAMGISLFAIAAFRPSLIEILACSLLPFLGLIASPYLFPSDYSSFGVAVEAARKQVSALEADNDSNNTMVGYCTRQYEEKRRLYDGIRRAKEYPLHRLLHVDFGSMSGPDFEQYLGEVFRFLGYAVQHTGRSGDQGVDLLVHRGTTRVAVQAKCYGGSVGNAAVQEAFAGMRFYGCQRCIVVTTSTFTHGARELANAVGCTLVEGNEIESLVRGKIPV